MDELTAIGRAQALVKDIASAPVDAVGIAQGLGFEVKFADLPANQAGNTFPKAGRKIICINQNDDPYRQRFTTLHEVAHHVLDLPSKHGEVLPPTSSNASQVVRQKRSSVMPSRQHVWCLCI